jgi:hypothetical protein
MLPQGKGSIVNISSAYGKVDGPAHRSMLVASTASRASPSQRPSNLPEPVFESILWALDD